MTDRRGFYFPHRDNHEIRPSDELKRYVRYFGPFTTDIEAGVYAATHHNVGEGKGLGLIQEYTDHEIQVAEELPGETLQAARAKFMHQDRADYWTLTFVEVRDFVAVCLKSASYDDRMKVIDAQPKDSSLWIALVGHKSSECVPDHYIEEPDGDNGQTISRHV